MNVPLYTTNPMAALCPHYVAWDKDAPEPFIEAVEQLAARAGSSVFLDKALSVVLYNRRGCAWHIPQKDKSTRLY